MRRIVAAMIVGLGLSLAAVPLTAQDGIEIIPQTYHAPTVEISPDGQYYAIYEQAGTAAVFEVEARELQIADATLEGKFFSTPDSIADAVFTPDSAALITLLANGDLLFWNVATGEVTNTVETTLLGETGQLIILPDGNTLLIKTVGYFTRYFVYDIEANVFTRILAARVEFGAQYREILSDIMTNAAYQDVTATLTEDEELLFTLDTANGITAIDIQTGERQEIRPPDMEPGLMLNVLSISVENDTLAYWFPDDEQTHLIDLATMEEREPLPFGGIASALTPDSGSLYWIDNEGNLYRAPLLPDAEPELIAALGGNFNVTRFAQLQFTPDGERLIVSALTSRELTENAVYIIDVPSP